jgi:hypothetical protein
VLERADVVPDALPWELESAGNTGRGFRFPEECEDLEADRVHQRGGLIS